jgi:hypothetical protein
MPDSLKNQCTFSTNLAYGKDRKQIIAAQKEAIFQKNQ